MSPIGWTIGFVGNYTTTATATTTASGGGGGAIVFSGSWVDSDYAANNASGYTFSGQNFGSADSSRLIVVTVGSMRVGSNDAPTSCTGVTIGGVSGTQVLHTLDSDGIISIWQALVPTGTSGSVVCNFSETANNCVIGVHRIVTGTQGVRNTGSDEVHNSGTEPSIAATVPTGGYGVVMLIASDNPHTGASGYTERFEHAIEGAGGSGTDTGSGGDFTASATITLSDTNATAFKVMAYASWGP